MELNTIEDWEEWAKLAEEDPEQFERERTAIIEESIMSQSAQFRHRSRQLQWKIDGVRRTSPNSLSACIRIYDMLMDSVYSADGLLAAIKMLDGSSETPCLSDEPRKKAGRRLEFRRMERRDKRLCVSEKQ